MGIRRPGLERQLQSARQDLASLTATLDSTGVGAEDRQTHPRWRRLHARRLHLEQRLRAADKLTALDEELKRRRAEKAAAAEAPAAPEPKAEKPAKGGKSKEGKPKGEKKSKEPKSEE
jgi:hypothetical protein